MNEYNGTEAALLLPEIAKYAHGIGPRESLIFYDLFWEAARTLKLKVHPWTQQDDMLKHTSNPVDETLYYLNRGVDGMFVEFPHLVKSVYEQHAKQQAEKE